jgi:polyhydroxybutyrate depolymerase
MRRGNPLLCGAALAFALLVSTGVARACGTDADCAVANGSYRVALPPDPAGKGAVVYLHGYRGTPEDAMRFGALRAVAAELDVALIAPRGEETSWNLPGAMPGGRDDVAFIRSVADDAAARFGLDRSRMMVAGFSVGGSMTWYVACAEGRGFAGYAPIAGAFWEPYVAECRSPLPEIRHVHGRTDGTVPLAGRKVSFAAEGDTFRSFALLGELSGCGEGLNSSMTLSMRNFLPLWVRSSTKS